MKYQLLTFFLGLAVQASAYLPYPISPRPLRKLIIESEYIVIGNVNDIRSVKTKKDDWFGGTEAEVTVYEVLQGEVSESILNIPFNPGMICPSPPRFKKDTDALMFLNKNKKDGKLYIHALSYGVKTLAPYEMQVYKARIAEMQQILLITDADQQFMETVEWLVTCAESLATRHEGTYELSPESDFMSYYDRSENKPFKFMLSADQRARLKQALLATSTNEPPDFALVDLVYPGNEQEIFKFLLAGIRDLQENRLWYADEYMSRLYLYKPSARLKEIITAYDEKRFDDNSEKKLPQIVHEFIVAIDQY